MLLETQVRLAGESIWVRTDGSEKTVYFPSDFVLTLGIRYRRTWRAMLPDLHLLLLLWASLHGPPPTSTVEVLICYATLVAKGKLRIFLILGHVNGTFVP